MSQWHITYLPEAERDFSGLDRTQQLQVMKAIEKVSRNPLPTTKGGLGKPLGSHSGNNLTGYLKIKLLRLGLRVVYRLIQEGDEMNIIVISVRDDETVYHIAKNRISFL
ncbi:type II toxin-antitoxin system RelE/ParE family toxin [Bengtsoniella intestinalis]|uniref:type II toxin-antitoxin system RelE family toxin n=1 Tax=Bengtsoniella intestinalis TaxID=3073143 RepID=UPI00391FC7B6